MKKTLTLILLAATFNFCHAQSINFKIRYLPNHTYQVTGSNTINITTDLSNNPQIAQVLTAQGISEPVNAVMDMKTSGTIITGAAKADKSVPFNMSFTFPEMNVNVNGKQVPIPLSAANTNMKMFGKMDASGTLSVDSLNGKQVTDSAALKAMNMLNGVFRMIKFPDHPIKPGESFTQDMPMNLPIPGFNFKIKITYKLISVNGDKAYFDVVQDMNMQMNMQGKMNANLTGGGTGKMVYDITNGFPLSYTADAAMKMSLKSDKFNIDADMKIKGSQTYTISAK